jgi:epoxyqueuosine reductase
MRSKNDLICEVFIGVIYMHNTDEIILKAIDLGYDKCGIVNIEKMKGYAEKLSERIERFPEVKIHSEDFYAFANLQSEYPWAKSIIICARWYGKYRIPENVKGHVAKYYLTDSRRDKNSQGNKDSVAFEQYLIDCGIKTMTNRDFGITALRWAAMKAGIGIVRKNNFLYTEKGSWVYLEAFLIDKDVEYIHENKIMACPEKCNLCVKACPTKSLAEPYMMNRSTCVSCLTTWEGWDLTTDINSSNLGNWIFGCDACQDVCPFNRKKWTEDEEFPFLSELCLQLSLEQIVEADYNFLRNRVQPKFWYIPQEKVWRYKTNALNTMLNAYKPEYLPVIQEACNDENKNVRNMANWVLKRL